MAACLAAGQHEQQGAEQPQAANEGAASEKQSPAAQDNGSNGSAGQNGQGQGSDTNGAPTSTGLPIAPLRLDSGLQVSYRDLSAFDLRFKQTNWLAPLISVSHLLGALPWQSLWSINYFWPAYNYMAEKVHCRTVETCQAACSVMCHELLAQQCEYSCPLCSPRSQLRAQQSLAWACGAAS